MREMHRCDKSDLACTCIVRILNYSPIKVTPKCKDYQQRLDILGYLWSVRSLWKFATNYSNTRHFYFE